MFLCISKRRKKKTHHLSYWLPG